MPSLPADSWRAPGWTGTEALPVLYEDHDRLLFVCAMIEEALERWPGALHLDSAVG